MDNEAETNKLWKIRKTIMELLHDRGYVVSQDELDETIDQFKEQFGDKPFEQKPLRSDLMVLVSHFNDASDQMIVFFSDIPKIGIKEIKTYCQRMEEQKIRRAIIVQQSGMTPSASRGIAAVASEFIIETFLDIELVNNVTHHELVPRHVVLTPEEKKELYAKYHLEDHKLMKLKITDPVSRYFGMKRGQVVKILRNSDITGRSIAYRIVN